MIKKALSAVSSKIIRITHDLSVNKKLLTILLILFFCGLACLKITEFLQKKCNLFVADLFFEFPNICCVLSVTWFFCFKKEVNILWYYRIITFFFFSLTYILHSIVLLNRPFIHSYLMKSPSDEDRASDDDRASPIKGTSFVIAVALLPILAGEYWFFSWYGAKKLYGKNGSEFEYYVTYVSAVFAILIILNVYLDNASVEIESAGIYRTTITAFTTILALIITVLYSLQDYWSLPPDVPDDSDDQPPPDENPAARNSETNKEEETPSTTPPAPDNPTTTKATKLPSASTNVQALRSSSTASSLPHSFKYSKSSTLRSSVKESDVKTISNPPKEILRLSGVSDSKQSLTDKERKFYNDMFQQGVKGTTQSTPSKRTSKSECNAMNKDESIQAAIAENKVNVSAKKNSIVMNAAAKPTFKPPVDVEAILRERNSVIEKSNDSKFVNLAEPPKNERKKKTFINRERLVKMIKEQDEIPKADRSQAKKRPAPSTATFQIFLTKSNDILEKENDAPLESPAKKSKIGKEYSAAAKEELDDDWNDDED